MTGYPLDYNQGMTSLDLELDLLERIRQGERAACDECVELHYEGMRRVAMRLVRDPLEAEDIVQEAFLNAFTGIQGFSGRSRLSTWLYRITYNVALNHLRKQAPASLSLEIPTPASDSGDSAEIQLFDWCCLPEDDLLRAEALGYIDKAIDHLPDTLREVFLLREFDGLSTAEVAQALGISESAAKVRLHRARQAMREQLETYFGRDFSYPKP